MRKIISGFAAFAVCASMSSAVFAQGVVPNIAVGGSSVVNNENTVIYSENKATYQNATIKDGRLTLSRVNSIDGDAYEYDVCSSIYKSVDFPTTGKVNIEIGSQIANGKYSFVELYSGTTPVARITFANFMCYTNGRFFEGNNPLDEYPTLITEPWYPFHVDSNYCVDRAEIDFDNNRMTFSQTRDGRTISSDQYYTDSYVPVYKGEDGKFYTDMNCTAESEDQNAKIGVPLNKMMSADGKYIKIDKIVLRGGKGSDGSPGKLSNIGGSLRDYVSYSHVNVTSQSGESTNVLIDDVFNDSSKIMNDYGWTYAKDWGGRLNYYFNTDNGYGVFFGKGGVTWTNTKIGFKLGQTFSSGKVALEFTVKTKAVDGNGNVSVYSPLGNIDSGNEAHFLEVYGTGSDNNKVMTALISNNNGTLVLGNNGTVMDGYTNSLFDTIFKEKENRYRNKIRFIFDLDNGEMTAYRNKTDDSDEVVRENSSRTYRLTTDANGEYSINELVFGVRSLQSDTQDNIIEYSDINVYAIDEENHVIKPALFDENNNEIQTASAGQTVYAYIPVSNENGDEINCIIGNYLSDGTFKDCTASPITSTGLVKKAFVVPNDASEGAFTRVFLWNNLKQMKPLADFGEVTVSGSISE